MSVSTTTFDPKVWATPPFDFQQLRTPPMSGLYFHQHVFLSRDPTTASTRSNEEVEALFQRQVSHKSLFNTASKSSCSKGLIGGLIASLLTQNPLPLLLGFSECFPQVSAQKKIGNEFQINTYTNNSQRLPSVSSLSNGNFVVTWMSSGQDGDQGGVYGQLFDENATKIENEIQVNTYTNNSQLGPSVSSLSNGNFVVTWMSLYQDGSSCGIFGQLFNTTGNKISGEFQVNTYTSNCQNAPSVTNLINRFVIVWHSYQDGGSYGIYGQMFDQVGKLGNEFRINSFTPNWQIDPSVASSSNGNFIVAWESLGQDGSAYGIYGQILSNTGSKIGNEFQVHNYTQNNQTSPSVASLYTDTFVIVWESFGQESSNYGIFGQLFDANGTKIENEFQVNSYTSFNQLRPSVANLQQKGFVVTWRSEGQDMSGNGVYGQLFDNNGAKIGIEFQIHNYETNHQENPSVASLTNGNFVVVWSSYGQDGSKHGIYGQVFYANITYASSSTLISSSTLSAPKSSSEVNNEISTSLSFFKKNFLWLWLLLGIGGGTICLGGISYLLNKLRSRKRNDDASATELGKKKETDSHLSEEHYQRTPDCISAGQESQYQRTPDYVSAGQESQYQLTPDHVRPEDGRQYGR